MVDDSVLVEVILSYIDTNDSIEIWREEDFRRCRYEYREHYYKDSNVREEYANYY